MRRFGGTQSARDKRNESGEPTAIFFTQLLPRSLGPDLQIFVVVARDIARTQLQTAD
jgi:hypothetical protein